MTARMLNLGVARRWARSGIDISSLHEVRLKVTTSCHVVFKVKISHDVGYRVKLLREKADSHNPGSLVEARFFRRDPDSGSHQ